MTNFEVVLEGELGLRDCHVVRDKLAEALTRAPSISIETHAVESVDLSILQLLVAAAKSATASDGKVVVNACEGGPLDVTAKRAGLTDQDGRATVPALHFQLS